MSQKSPHLHRRPKSSKIPEGSWGASSSIFSVWLRLLAGIATALMQISTPAAADDITIDTAPFQSSATRAEVRAQLQQFKKAGPPPWSISYNPLQGFKSTRSREEVRREMAASRDEMRALYGEDSGSIILRQPVPR